jgi:hypothetical protein
VSANRNKAQSELEATLAEWRVNRPECELPPDEFSA